MAKFSTLDQVTNKIFLGKYLVVSAPASGGEEGGLDTVAFADPEHSVALCFLLVAKKGRISLRTVVEGKNNGNSKLLVFNQAEPPNVLLRSTAEQGDLVLKLVQTSKFSWFLSNSKESVYVGCKKNDQFFFSEQEAQAAELFLELAEYSLLKKLEVALNSTSIQTQYKKELRNRVDGIVESLSGKFISPILGAFYSIVSSGAIVRLQSHHNSWLKVDWSRDPPKLCTTSNKQDPCTEFHIIGLSSTALIFQRKYFMNVSSDHSVCFTKEPCFIGLEFDLSCKRMAIFIPFIEERLYLCVTRKQNIEFHRKKRAWELLQVFVNEEHVDTIISKWDKKPVVVKKQQESEKESNKDFCYSKAIGNADNLPAVSNGKKNSSENNETKAKNHTSQVPQPRKKKNKRRARQDIQTSCSDAASSQTNTKKQELRYKKKDLEEVKENRISPDTNDQNGDNSTLKSSIGEQALQPSSHSSRGSNHLCGSCHQPIMSSYATALGKSFHPECLRCFRCGKTLVTSGDGNFRHGSGKPYCNECYAQHIAPRCAKCLQPIVDTVTKAMKQNWHPQCLICTQCNTPLSAVFYLFPELPRHPVCSRCAVGIEQNEMRRKQMRNQSHLLSTTFRLGTLRPFGSR
ncbi:Transforming growth factor beta-1-induced transcript 1 protein [Galdieria sulphuraria]|nr:Transforming growth factor beta-1-induced transcript 1 protein [Galdieria sulphuraria]